MRALLLFGLALAGCTGSTPTNSDGGNDLATLDGGGDLTMLDGGDVLCATQACALSPCTPGCAFAAAIGGACGTQYQVSPEQVHLCAGFCGLVADNPQAATLYGCLRFRNEDPNCTALCDPWSTWSCFERSPDVNYQTGGAICDSAKGFFCDSGPAPDAGIPCDMAHD
jgi:hypothetical protein